MKTNYSMTAVDHCAEETNSNFSDFTHFLYFLFDKFIFQYGYEIKKKTIFTS